MAKKSSYEDKLNSITDNNAKLIKKAYLSVIKEVSALVNKGALDSNNEFSFKKNPTLEKKVDAILKNLNSNIYGTVSTGINSAWDLAVEKNNGIAKKALGKSIEKLPTQYKNKYLSNNQKAKQGFVNRKIKGLGLSDRIWNNTGQFKAELELALELSIGSGKSAARTVKDIKGYLNKPDELYRKVRDEKGNLRLSKAAEAYHPGTGRYRSSYKNSQRLARNEINFSYEKSNQLKIQGQDFVVGIEIRVSKNHSPKMDLGGISCDALQGKYPKNFDFSNKWHVNCRCVSYTILKTPEELQQDVKNILSGGQPDGPETSSNSIKGLPESYNKYITENADKWKSWTNQPRFLSLNESLLTPVNSKVQTINQDYKNNSVNAKYTDSEKLLEDFSFKEFKDNQYNTLQGYVSHMQGFDGLPTKVSELEFEKLKSSGKYTSIHRGLKEDAQSRIKQFKEGDLFHGQGIFGDGTYFANTAEEAATYASGIKENTFEALFDSENMRVANFNDLREEFKNQRTKLGPTFERMSEIHGENWISLPREITEGTYNKLGIYNEFGAWATSQGYDLIVAPQYQGNIYYVLLNRTKLIVK